MKKFVLIFIILFSFLCLWGVIESAPGGGYWNNENSWIGYIVPGPNDDVLIASNIDIDVDATCHNLTISSSGLIQNSSGSNRLLTINGNLSNAGLIRNYTGGSYFLDIAVYGDLNNIGNIQNRKISFYGNENQYLSNMGSLSPVYITDENSLSSLILLSDLYLQNTIFDLNNSTLIMNGPDGTFNLSMDGGYMTDAVLEGGNGATFSMTGGSYLENISANEIAFAGTVIVKNDVSINNLVNQGTIMNASGSNYTLTVSQSLTNYSTIQNGVSNKLDINLGGDLYNYGNITNRYITLFNQVQHQLLADDVIHPIACNYFIIADSEVNCKALSNLYFTNCSMNLNAGTLSLTNENQSFGLYLDGGYLSYATLDGGTESVLKLENNAYLSNVTMDDLIWQGTVIITSNVSINNLVNQGTIMNASGSNYTLTVSQSLTNNGTIQDIGYNKLDINLGGDLYNYSIIQNRRIYLNGFQDQYVLNVGTISVPYFYAAANIGAAFWYFNGILPVGSSLQSDKSINPNEPGVWHPYNPETGQNGRYIIVSNNNQALATPSNLSISLANGIPKLSWNKVNGALYYNIYTAPTPEGPYTLLGKAFNFNSYNDIIEFNINDPQPLQFFRVTTGN